MKKIIGLITIILSLLMLSGCDLLTGVSRDGYSQRLDSVTQEESAIAQEFGFELESVVEWEDEYVIAAHYPITGHENIDADIIKFIESKIEGFKINLTEAGPPHNEFYDFELMVDFLPVVIKNKYLTIKFDTHQYLGGAHFINDVDTFYYDLEKDEAMEQADFFNNENYLEILSDISREMLTENEDIMAMSDEDWIREGTEPTPKNFANIVFVEEGLDIYFSDYQIGAYALGQQKITIPYEKVNEVISDRLSADIVPVASASADDPGIETVILASAASVEDKKQVALTFDDGPHKTYTPKILDVLKEKGAHATFFVLGHRVDYHADIMKRIVAEGHEIGNHSWNHPQFTRLSDAQIREQIENTQAAVERVTGFMPIIIRPPYGAFDERVQSVAGMPIVLWSVDPQDWLQRNAYTVRARVLSRTNDGDIVILHDIFSSSADAIAPIIDNLQSQGYEFVTVSQMLGFIDDPELITPGKIYHQK